MRFDTPSVFRTERPVRCPECEIERVLFAHTPGKLPVCLFCEAKPLRPIRKRRWAGFISLEVIACIIASAALFIGPLPVFALALAVLAIALFVKYRRGGEEPPTAAEKKAPTPQPPPRSYHRPVLDILKRHRPIGDTGARRYPESVICHGCNQPRQVFSEFGVCMKCSPVLKNVIGPPAGAR